MRVPGYELLGELGRGGAGVVFRARAASGREVALKVCTRLGPEARARFAREARIGASLGTGFVPVLDVGDGAQGPFLVMPLFEGGSLRDRLARGPLSIEEAVDLVRDLASALGRAHASGIVHRDLKPENVLFDRDGAPAIADLGLAKHFAGSGSDTQELSLTGSFRGTPGYGAPEQLVDAKSAGPEADVFALGALLYECIAGVAPFADESVLAVVDRVREGSFPPLARRRRGVPAWLDAAVARCLAVRPERRFADATELARALERPAPARSRARAVALVFVASGGAAALLLAATRPPEPGPASPPARAAPVASASRGDLPPRHEGAPPAVKEAIARLHAGDRAGARALVEEALARDPTEPFALAFRAEQRLDGDPDGALADADRAVAHGRGLAATWGTRGTVRLERAVKLDPTARRPEVEAAVDDFAAALAIDPVDATYRYNRGCALNELGRLDEALAEATRAIELAPDKATYWLLRASVLGRSRDKPSAYRDLVRVLELDPEGPSGDRARQLLGPVPRPFRSAPRAVQDAGLVLKARDPARARALLDRAVAQAPDEPYALALRAELRLREDLEGALADAERAVARGPDVAAARAVRAYAFSERARRGPAGSATARADLERALADYSVAIERDPEDPGHHGGRANVHRELERYVEAHADLVRACDLAPRFANHWLKRGSLSQLLGESERARAELERVLELDPAGPDGAAARELLGKLR